jgi:hypothetical protein
MDPVKSTSSKKKSTLNPRKRVRGSARDRERVLTKIPVGDLFGLLFPGLVKNKPWGSDEDRSNKNCLPLTQESE